MKKQYIRSGIIVLVIFVIGVVVTASVNQWLAALVRRQLDNNIAAAADSIRFTYGNVRVAAFRGKAQINDVYVAFRKYDEDSTYTDLNATIAGISMDGINHLDWLTHRQVHLKGFTITRPVVQASFYHDPQLAEKVKLKSDLSDKENMENFLRIARIIMDDAVIGRITIDKASVDALAYNDSLRILVPEINMSLYDLGYNVKDQTPHYNDSIFHFLMRNIEMYVPDADVSLTVKSLQAEPNGIINIQEVLSQTYLDSLHHESIHAGVQSLAVGGFDAAKFNQIKQMEIRSVHLYDPFINVVVDETVSPQSQKTTKEEMEVLNARLQDINVELATKFITGLVVDTILVHNAACDIHSSVTSFNVHADSLFVALYGLGYSLIDEVPYHYNDSVYQFYVGHATITTPDSLTAITTSSIRYDNGGAFSIGPTRVRNIVDKWKLGAILNMGPATWIDLSLNSLHTSSKNILREVFTIEDGFFLDSIYVDIQSMSVFRDVRQQPVNPFTLPQVPLLQLSYPFVINHVDAKVHRMNIEVALTKQCVGHLNLNDLCAQLSNVTAIRNSTITLNARCGVGRGVADARIELDIKPTCDWRIALNARDLNLHFLDDMLYPMVGLKVGAEVSSLVADYQGDNQIANGTFCLQYDNLSIHAYKDSQSPFTIVGDLSGLINSASKTLLNKRNPRYPGKAPLAYQVQWKNDPWQQPALFYIGPCIDGCIKTLLPGLFVHKRVKEQKSK